METRANYVVVGIFTVLAVLAAFAFVYWTAGIGDTGETSSVRFRIPGSASGLSRGSAVLFNGVKVGDVQRVYIDVANPAVAVADAEVDRLTPIKPSTRAIVGLAGLTGQANIELRGGRPEEANVLDVAAEEERVAELVADPSAVTNLLESAQTIFARAEVIVGELEGFVEDARDPLTNTLRNVEEFSGALGRNAEGIDTFLASVTSMADTLAGVSGQLELTLSAAERVIAAIDSERINRAVTNVESFTRRLDEASAGFEGMMDQVEETVAAVSTFSATANQTISRVEEIVAGVDPQTVRSAVGNFERATSNVSEAAAEVAKIAADIGGRSEDIDRIITDAQQLAERLSQASARAESIMTGVDQAVQSFSTFSQAGEKTLTRVDEIVSGVDPAAVASAVTNFERASRNVDDAADRVAKLADDIGGRSEDIDTIITDAQQIANRLNAASTRVDGILVRVDELLGSGEAEGVMADASETLRAIKQVADTLNARLATITDNFARFSGAGLQSIETLVQDSRRSINRIEQAITDLERNPQRILSGGEGSVREYDGRARR